MKHKSIVVLGLVALLLLGQHFFAAGVAQAALPSRVVDRHDKGEHPGPVGAYIEMLPSAAMTADSWSVVQWQDSSGGWHDVEGWQTSTADGGRWWVDVNHNGVQDEEDSYFQCPLLGPGVPAIF